MDKRLAFVVATAAALAVGPAFGSGFAFYEQGAKASGQAGAWVARADDASANWYNPAALAFMSGRELQFGVNYLDVGSDTKLVTGIGTFDAISNVETPAQIYFSQKINDRVAWGVGVNNPFGLATEWPSPVSQFSKRAELVTYLINPNIAFKLHEYWSLGIGLDYLTAEVHEFSRDIAVPPTTSNLTGEGDAIGYNAALAFRHAGFSIAGTYRSGFTPKINGQIRFSGAAGNLFNSSATAAIDLPSEATIAVAWSTKRFDVETDAYHTAWNSFQSLIIQTPSPLTSVSLVENWKAVWAYRLGLAFRIDQEGHHEIRAGAYVDQSPVPTQYLRPSIPDSDRTGYSLGYGWQGKKFGIDVYAMRLDFDDVTATGTPADGVLPGTYQTSINLFGGTFKYRF
ncbi:MAG TPA: outer membrane protein transport protein [Candidatus Polarisedimenticolaceae bacterium]|nr:outer membrane protein transport protein [Candidatus Polarisedimenticolaceae bacterium]